MRVRFLALICFALSLISASAQIRNWYNGYSPEERNKKLALANQKLAAGELPEATGPCMLCGDPDALVEYHSEDYGEPFLWEPPAVYSLCQTCHRFKLHGRFARPEDWETYLAHIRRGGYARDLKEADVAAELMAYRKALQRGSSPAPLKTLRPYKGIVGEEWFARLRMDKESLTDPTARPRADR
ncbi:MAG: hypothetical protein H3C50_00295 [Kiritimatiellae bacterium]|nr:hypothetical protein [Kiritimatiellia bacterium]MCO5068899.1 hypothetical protein [Kiritimatiellia bacterium]